MPGAQDCILEVIVVLEKMDLHAPAMDVGIT
jgi:hypothetical protein